MGLDPVDSLLFSIGLVLESGYCIFFSKNLERECPMVSFTNDLLVFGLFGEQTVIIELSWGRTHNKAVPGLIEPEFP